MTISRGLGSFLTQQQAYNLARDAGFSPDNARTVVAIAMRESALNPAAVAGSVAGSTEASYGLMQINMQGSLGTSRLIQFGISSPTQLLDPATNMRAAYILSGGSNFGPWNLNSDTAQIRQKDGTLLTVNLGYRTKYLANLASLPADLEAGYSPDLTDSTTVTDLNTTDAPPVDDGSMDLSTIVVPVGIMVGLWLWLR